MMERLTDQEARDLAERLIPPVSVVNRAVPMTGDEMLLGISDTIGRALMTDTDGVFALIRHLVVRTRFQAAQIVEDVESLRRLGPAARAEAPSATTQIPQLVDLLDQMLTAPAGRLTRLRTRFKSVAAKYARSSRTRDGRQTVGLSPYQAMADGLVRIARIEKMVPVLLANTERVQTALADYVATDLDEPSHLRGLQHARDVLQSHAARLDTDQSPAIVDAVLVSGMLETTLAPDPRLDKYAGAGTLSAVGAGGWTATRLLTLTGAVSSWSPFRPGDPVMLDGAASGTVSWTNGAAVRFVDSLGLAAGPRTVRIRSRGLVSYEQLSNLTAGLISTGQQYERRLAETIRLTRVYFEAGTATNGMARLEEIRTWAALVGSTLGNYEASGVDTIEALLESLQHDRLPQLADALMECRFYSLRDVGPLLSAPAQMGDLLQEAYDSLGLVETDVLVRQGRSGVDDYFYDGEG